MSAVFTIKYPFNIGEKAPYFENLPNIDGKPYSLSNFNDKAVVVLIFMANRCPTARVYTDRLKAIQTDYQNQGVQLVGINSENKYFFSTETLEKMTQVFNERELNFPYLKDEDQTLAKKYGALVTLHTFVLDKDRRLRYRGRVDDSRDPQKVTVNDLRNALDDVLSQREVRVLETRPFACSIEYF